MLRAFLIICLIALIETGRCTPMRMLPDAKARDTRASPQEMMEGWNLWDTDGGQFPGRVPQFAGYNPTVGQLTNFGYSRKVSDDSLSMSSNSKPFRMWQPNCDDLDLTGGNLWDLMGAVRCRRTTREWMVQRPMYVNEPHWVPINVENIEAPEKPPVDPFIIARGKRSIDINEKFNLSKSMNSTRQKRQIPTDIDLEAFAELQPRIGYVEPRDKHSEIMDILREPFFISRGKKSRSKKDDVPRFAASASSRNYRMARDRRGEIMEQLLKEQDPFFIARGRRAINSF